MIKCGGIRFRPAMIMTDIWIYLITNTAEINMRKASQSAAFGLHVGMGNKIISIVNLIYINILIDDKPWKFFRDMDITHSRNKFLIIKHLLNKQNTNLQKCDFFSY